MNPERRWYVEAVVDYRPSNLAAVVFDGDDTLWNTEVLYDRARDDARGEVVRSGLNGCAWEQIERRIDVENVTHFGFSTERFPTSCVQAYEALAQASGLRPDTEVAQRVRSAASRVFAQDPPLKTGAREILQILRSRGVKLALLTKGDHDLQSRRIERSGLIDLFDAIHIVPEKTSADFSDIVAELGFEPNDSWSVGNSIRSDIQPAIEAGLRAVWIDAHVWEHERFDGQFGHDRLLVVDDLSRLAHAIDGVLTKDT